MPPVKRAERERERAVGIESYNNLDIMSNCRSKKEMLHNMQWRNKEGKKKQKPMHCAAQTVRGGNTSYKDV